MSASFKKNLSILYFPTQLFPIIFIESSNLHQGVNKKPLQIIHLQGLVYQGRFIDDFQTYFLTEEVYCPCHEGGVEKGWRQRLRNQCVSVRRLQSFSIF